MRKVITESQLQNLINNIVAEEIQRSVMEEGFWGNVGRGLKNAFGGDAAKIGQGAQKFGNAVGRGLKNAAGAVGNAANAVGQGVKNAASAVGRGVQQRATAFKDSYNASKYSDKFQSILDELNELVANGALNNVAAKKAIGMLKGAFTQQNSANSDQAAASRNAIGTNPAANEAIIRRAVRESMRRILNQH